MLVNTDSTGRIFDEQVPATRHVNKQVFVHSDLQEQQETSEHRPMGGERGEGKGSREGVGSRTNRGPHNEEGTPVLNF